MTIDLTLVVPVFNEEASIDGFLARVVPILERITPFFEILFVNDGSRDRTAERVRAAHAREGRVKLVDLSRNFGKEAALSAGLDLAAGRMVVPIDVDLQDPPELIAEMVERWREGFDMVLARRTDRSSDGRAKRVTAGLFYRVIGRLSDTEIPDNVGDFRLMDRQVVEALKRLPERTRFMKGMFAWLGFRQCTVGYVRPERASGTTKLRPLALWRLALEGIVSFSSVPLRMSGYVGSLCALVGLLYGGLIVARVLFHGADVPGYASLLTAILFFNGVVLMSLGLIGEYVARIFIEVKGRPVYLVRDTLGWNGGVGPERDRRLTPPVPVPAPAPELS